MGLAKIELRSVMFCYAARQALLFGLYGLAVANDATEP